MPDPVADAARMDRAALFASHYIAACVQAGINEDIESRALSVMTAWHSARIFLERVASGEDVKLYAAMQATNAKQRQRAIDLQAADEKAAAEQRARARAEFGATVTA